MTVSRDLCAFHGIMGENKYLQNTFICLSHQPTNTWHRPTHEASWEFIKTKSVSILMLKWFLRDGKQRFSHCMTNKVQASDISPWISNQISYPFHTKGQHCTICIVSLNKKCRFIFMIFGCKIGGPNKKWQSQIHINLHRTGTRTITVNSMQLSQEITLEFYLPVFSLPLHTNVANPAANDRTEGSNLYGFFEGKSIFEEAQLFSLPWGSSTSTFFAWMEIERRLLISWVIYNDLKDFPCRLIYVLFLQINSTLTFIIILKWNGFGLFLCGVLRIFAV